MKCEKNGSGTGVSIVLFLGQGRHYTDPVSAEDDPINKQSPHLLEPRETKRPRRMQSVLKDSY